MLTKRMYVVLCRCGNVPNVVRAPRDGFIRQKVVKEEQNEIDRKTNVENYHQRQQLRNYGQRGLNRMQPSDERTIFN